jgi:hypothetical protein
MSPANRVEPHHSLVHTSQALHCQKPQLDQLCLMQQLQRHRHLPHWLWQSEQGAGCNHMALFMTSRVLYRQCWSPQA